MSSSRVFIRAQIKALIAQEQVIVISDKQVLRLNEWIQSHPGGRLPILHMVRKDDRDQILALSLPPSTRHTSDGTKMAVGFLLIESAL